MRRAESDYSKKLRDPRWQKRRLEILQRDEWACSMCGDAENTLHVHHMYYLPGLEPWEYEDSCLITLCVECHDAETDERPTAEAAFLFAARSKFYACDLAQIAEAIRLLPVADMVLATALAHALTDWRGIVARYFDYLKEKQEAS